MRKIIGDRESALKQKISEQFRAQEASLRMQEEKLVAQLQAIHSLQVEVEKTQNESDIKMLNQSMGRMELLRRATLSIEEVSYSIPFEEFHKDSELAFVLKMLTPARSVSVSQVLSGKKGNHNKLPAFKEYLKYLTKSFREL